MPELICVPCFYQFALAIRIIVSDNGRARVCSQTHWNQLNPLSSSSCRWCCRQLSCRARTATRRLVVCCCLLTLVALLTLSQHDALTEAADTSISNSTAVVKVLKTNHRGQTSFRLLFFRILVHRSQRKWSHHRARFFHSVRSYHQILRALL